MSTKDDQIRAVASELDELLDALRASVRALSGVLNPGAAGEGGHDGQEEVPVS